MKEYSIIELPIYPDLKNRSKEDLKEYYEWYINIMPERLKQLSSVINANKSYISWKADYSPNSLEKLGKWFFENVEIRNRNENEIKNIYENSPIWFQKVNINKWELSDRTFSLAIDIGMYITKTFLENNKVLKMTHRLIGRKDDICYGQPVISGFKNKMEFNPTHIIITLAYGFADKTKNSSRLKEVYDIWIKLYL